jgi:filamentous hemagglutinin family protein
MVKAIFGLCVLLAALPVAPAFAAPSGEQVVQGEATFTQDGNTTIIDTGTHETIVQYDSFDIYQDEIVEINQPTDDSRILNHIPHGDPTVLNGTLLSNGFVFIVNPAGVFAGDTAIIDVGGLVAAAGDLSYEDFLAGEDRFTGLRGDVEVAEGALIRADQSVLLLGRRVANYGTVIAEGGLVAFVAGDNAVLGSLDGHLIVRVDGAGGAAAEEADFALTQAGTVDAGDGRVALSAGDTWSLAMNHTGVTRGHQIELEARGDGIVQVAGTLDASAAGEGQTGGSIRVLGGRVAVLDARLDASGDAGGGEILVGGDLHGQGDLATSRRTYVDSDAKLLADALSSGDGGKIIVWADEATGFYGKASARGGSASGDGGFVEISGRQFLEARGHEVDLSAPNGRSGTLLHDPAEIVVVGGAPDPMDPPPEPNPVDGNDVDGLPDSLVSDGGIAGRILTGDVGVGDYLDGAFAIHESEIEGTDADIVLEAEHRIYTSGSFVGDDVVVMPGNSLVIQTTGDGVDSENNPVEFAIDLGEDLTWQVSEGGIIFIATAAGDPTNPDASASAGIRAGNLVFLGRAFDEVDGVEFPLLVSDPDLADLGFVVDEEVGVLVATTVGNIEIASIQANGDDGENSGLKLPSSAAGVQIEALAGDIDIGTIEAFGGSAVAAEEDPMGEASPGNGGFGGFVLVRSDDGSIVIRDGIDASGGDGLAGIALPPDSEVPFPIVGNGGVGGAIVLEASTLLAGVDDTPSATVTVSGSLIADGGDSEGVAGLPVGDGLIAPLAGEGGRGGGVRVTADFGIVVQDSVISASGGNGVAGGGEVSSSFSSIVVETPVLDATSDVMGIQLANSAVVTNGGSVLAGGPGGAGGTGGGVLINAGNGRVDAATSRIEANGGAGLAGPEDGEFSLQGAGGGTFSVRIEGAEGVSIGSIASIGGAGENADAGQGGDIDVDSAQGDIEIGIIDVSGGDAVTTAEEAVGVEGGRGGRVDLVTGVADLAAPGGDVLLGDRITAFGGEVTEVGDGGAVLTAVAPGGSVDISAEGAIAAAPSATAPARIEAGRIELEAPVIDGVAGHGLDLAGTSADDDRAILTASESITANVIADSGLEDVEVEHREETTASLLTIDGDAALMVAAGAPPPTSTAPAVPTTITLMQTQGGSEPALHFVLDAVPSDDLSGRTLELQIADNAVSLGPRGGSIQNDDGAITGEADAAQHAETTGDLLLEAASIGADGPLQIAGAAEAELRLVANGDVRVDVGSAFGAIDLSQANPEGSTTLGGIEQIQVDGAPAGPDPVQVLSGTLFSDAAFAYRLRTAEATGASLQIQDLVLGGNGLAEVDGDLLLQGGAGPNVSFESGNFVTLDAGGDITWTDPGGGVAIQQTGSADDPGALLLLARDGSVGSAAGGALVTQGVANGTLELAGAFGGDFRLENQVDGELHIAQILVPDPTDASGETIVQSVTGIVGLAGTGGVVEIGNQDRDIVLGAIPMPVLRNPPGHVLADGDVTFHSDVEIENAQFVEVPVIDEDGNLAEEPDLVAANTAGILSLGGDVRFEGAVDTSAMNVAVDDEMREVDTPVDATLIVQAGGFVDFEEDVGATHALATLDTSAARLPVAGEMREFHVVDAILRGGLEGPGGARFLRPDPDALTSVAFGGDVGAFAPLDGLEVEADRIDFAVNEGPSAELVQTGTGGIHLDTGETEVPDVATITDARGDLRFVTSGEFEVGDLDKLSAVGVLEIHASEHVRVGDLSALTLSIQAPEIQLLTREASDVLLQDGATVTDAGVDWVANAITTSTTPVPDDPVANVAFYLGSGGISMPGDLSQFDVRRLDESLDAVSSGAFIGPDGVVLDLTGNGPLLVGDPTREVPRRRPLALPDTLPRFGSEPPGPPVQVVASQVLAFMRCSGVYATATSGDACSVAERASLASVRRLDDSALGTPRAREIGARYRRLVASPGSRERLRGAFTAAGAAFGATREWRDGSLDGAEFYRFLESAPRAQRPALASVLELAWLFTQIELLDLADADTRELQRTLAQEFADAAGLAGLSSDVVIAAVDASPVGLVE